MHIAVKESCRKNLKAKTNLTPEFCIKTKCEVAKICKGSTREAKYRLSFTDYLRKLKIYYQRIVNLMYALRNAYSVQGRKDGGRQSIQA